MAKIDPMVKEILSKYMDDPQSALWALEKNKDGKKSVVAWIAKHRDLEMIAAKEKISFAPPVFIEHQAGNSVAMCVTGSKGDISEWSVGEAALGLNYHKRGNMDVYPYAMAEKRAKDRVILKLLGLHGHVYSEDEIIDGAEAPQVDPSEVDPSIEDEINSVQDLDGLRGLYHKYKNNAGAMDLMQKKSETLKCK